MTAAPVGFQCPDEIAAARQVQARTTFGGTISAKPTVTYALIGICVGVYVAVGVFGLLGGTNRWAMIPLLIAFEDQWFRLVSSMFMHAGLLHIGFNMYVLAAFGPPLEQVLGRARFLTLYLLAGLGGSVASFMFSPVNVASVGASGAIFGILAATIVVGRALGQNMTQVIVLLGINVAIGFVVGGIDWRAHFGGAVVGACVAFLMARPGRNPQERQRRNVIQLVGCVAIAVVMAAACLTRDAEIEDMLRSGRSAAAEHTQDRTPVAILSNAHWAS